MKFEHLLQRLHESKIYEDFAKKHKNSFLVAGFFVLDMESKNHMYQIDYYVPSENKMAAFNLASPITMQMLDMVKSDSKPTPLSNETKIDLDSLPGILDDEMKNRSISEEIKKMVAILHTSEGRSVWNVSCMLSGLSIVKAHVEDKSESILKMERSSLMDIMKKVPGKVGQNVQAAVAAQASKSEQGEAPKQFKKMSKEDINAKLKDELSKLDNIEAEIEKEKTAIKAQLEKEKFSKNTKKNKNK